MFNMNAYLCTQICTKVFVLCVCMCAIVLKCVYVDACVHLSLNVFVDGGTHK